METETNQLPEPPPSDYVIVVGYPRNPISGQFLKGPIDPKIVKKWGYGFTTDLEQAWPFSSENQAKAKAAIVDRHMAWGDGVLMVEPNAESIHQKGGKDA